MTPGLGQRAPVGPGRAGSAARRRRRPRGSRPLAVATSAERDTPRRRSAARRRPSRPVSALDRPGADRRGVRGPPRPASTAGLVEPRFRQLVRQRARASARSWSSAHTKTGHVQERDDVTPSCDRMQLADPEPVATGWRGLSAGRAWSGRRTCWRTWRSPGRRTPTRQRGEIASRIAPSAKNGKP